MMIFLSPREELTPTGVDEEVAARSPGRLMRGLEWLGIAIMAALCTIVFVNAVSRYALSVSFTWGEEIVNVLLVWIAVVGLLIAVGRKALITCDILAERLPSHWRRPAEVGRALLCAAAMLLFAWFSWRYLLVFGRDVTPMLGLPKGLVIGALVLCGIAAGVAFLVQATRRALTGPRIVGGRAVVASRTGPDDATPI